MMQHVRELIAVKQLIAVSLTLFSVIDILGTIPIIFRLRKRLGGLQPMKTTAVASAILLVFLFAGSFLLEMFGITTTHFSLAGSLVLFLMGLEMVLNIQLFQLDTEELDQAHMTPLAFPIIAGPGTMTILLTLQAEYSLLHILLGLLGNMVVVYLVLRYVGWIERRLGREVVGILHRIMGIILLAMAIKIFRLHCAI